MARVFVSHSSRDQEAAARLKAWLIEQGFEAPFLDFDKHTGIPPGANWERTLYRELSTSEAMLIVHTSNWRDSKWCFAEFTQARALGKPIFPVIEAPDGETLIAPDIQALDLWRDREGGLAQLARELIRVALDAQGGFAWDARRPPYPGLLAFEAEDAAVYFGRDDDIRRLIERLNARRVQGGSKLLALLGASGSGKSSLLRAGVLPRLGRDRRRWVVTPPFRPQLHPLDELARMMTLVLGRPFEWRSVRDGLLGNDPVRVLGDWAEDVRLAAGAHDGQVLLAVDQAEELYGTADRAEALRFEVILGAALGAPLPLMAMLAMRSDFLEALQRSEALGGLFEEFSLGPLPLARVPQIIEGPARVAGLVVEDELVMEATRDAATEDALPLLAFALRELHERHGRSGRLTVDGYRALGDLAAGLSPLENAVRKAADAVVAQARPGESELRALKDAFVPALVRVNDAGEYVRRPAVWTDLPAAAHHLLEQLVQARLLIRRQEGATSVVEVTHEALLRKWPRLRAWLDEERAFLIGRQQLEQDLRDWQEAPAGDEPKALLTGLKLARAKSWLAERPHQLTPEERGFVQASLERAEAEEQRAARQRRNITIGSAVAAAVLAVFAVFAGYQSYRASAEQRRAELEAEGALAERTRALDLARVSLATEWQSRDTTKAALILTEIDDPDKALATRKLGELLRLPLVHAELLHDEAATFVAFSPRGARIVTLAGHRIARVWDTVTGRPLTPPLTHEEAVTLAAVSPDEATLLTVAGGVVHIRDIVSGVAREGWSDVAPVSAAAFLGEGDRVAVAGGREVWIRDVRSGALLFDEPWRLDSEATHLAVAAGHDQVAAASADGRITIWNAVSGVAVDDEPRAFQDVRQLAWSPSGSILLAASWRGIALWDTATGEHWSTDEGAGEAWFEPDGRRFVTSHADGGLLWTPKAGAELEKEVVPHGRGRLLATTFRRSNAGLLTLSGTGFNDRGGSLAYSIYGVTRVPTVMRTWHPKTREADRTVTLTLDGDLIGATFAPNGRLLATLSGTPRGGGRGEELEPDAIVRLWNVEVAGERFVRALPGSEPALSADGELVMTVVGAAVHVWRTADGSPHPAGPLRHDRRIVSALFSPNATTLAALTDDGAIHLHSLSTGTRGAVRVIDARSRGDVAFSTDGLLWVEGAYGVAGVWDATTGIILFPEAPADCNDTAHRRLDQTAHVLVRFCREQTYAWTRRNDRFEGPAIWPPGGSPYVFAVAPGSAIIAIAVGEVVELRDARSGEVRQRIEVDARRIAFSPDGDALAIADVDGRLRILGTKNGAEHIRWHVGEVKRIAFAAEGQLILTEHEVFGQDGVLKLWQVRSGGLRSTIPLAGVRGAGNWTLGADGQSVITWSGNSAQLWSLSTGEALFAASFDHPPRQKIAEWMRTGDIANAAVTYDRSHLVTATENETRIWTVAGRLLRQTLRDTVGGCLAPTFRETVLGEPADEARSAHARCIEEFGAVIGATASASTTP